MRTRRGWGCGSLPGRSGSPSDRAARLGRADPPGAVPRGRMRRRVRRTRPGTRGWRNWSRRGVDEDPPRQARGIQPLENGLSVVVEGEVLVGDVDDEPRRRGRVVEGPVRECLRGHLAVPVIEGGETPGDRGYHRYLLGGVAGHDLRVLL